MLFNSLEFVVFFVVVLSLYWALRGRLSTQNGLLLVSSYLFYGWWDVRFLFLIVVSTVVDYSVALIISSGTISKIQRIKASTFLLVSALLFIVIKYDSLNFSFNAFSPEIIIDWGGVFADSMGLWILVATLSLIVIANVLYPYISLLEEQRRRKLFLMASIVSNLSILGFFKYFGFFADSLSAVSESLFGITLDWWTLNIILPVGISFYTFQTMSYTIDVYRRELKASDQLLEFATYVSFFPQLVAGPIERGKHLLPQFRKHRPSLTWDDCREGTWLIVWGLFKKMVIADGVAVIVNTTFGPYDSMTSGGVVPDDGLRLLVGLYAFAIQIYCDFSGYTDIARGVAKLMGFNLMLNFRLPYFATTPSSFWQQWHISLSTWLRDYLYIPLGGNRGGNLKAYRNLTLTMLLGGLWHGASWTFVIWGAYHGFLLTIYRVLGIKTEKGAYPWWKLVIMGIIMFHLTCIGWLIFRAQNVSTISIFLQSIIFSPEGSLQAWLDFKTLIFYSWFLILFQVVQAVTGKLDPMFKWHWFIRLNIWVYVIMSLLVLSTPDSQEFIYFAF